MNFESYQLAERGLWAYENFISRHSVPTLNIGVGHLLKNWHYIVSDLKAARSMWPGARLTLYRPIQNLKYLSLGPVRHPPLLHEWP